jgi:ribosome maturation factor RimP
MENSLAGKISEFISPVLKVLGYELWGCEILSYGKRTVLRVYIDKPSGINVDDCRRASNQLNALPDLEEMIAGRFDLEVSSPGLDRQLYSDQHYLKYIGKKVQVKLHTAKNDRRNFVGIIKAVAEGNISVDVDGETLKLTIAEIDKARLIPELDFKK